MWAPVSGETTPEPPRPQLTAPTLTLSGKLGVLTLPSLRGNGGAHRSRSCPQLKRGFLWPKAFLPKEGGSGLSILALGTEPNLAAPRGPACWVGHPLRAPSSPPRCSHTCLVPGSLRPKPTGSSRPGALFPPRFNLGSQPRVYVLKDASPDFPTRPATRRASATGHCRLGPCPLPATG